MPEQAISIKDVHQAKELISSYVHRTPVLSNQAVNDLAGYEIFFKCENLQKVGAFKFRGGCNAIFRLSEESAKSGVVTHSSGNHAQAIALAARTRGIPAHIVMPTSAPIVKKNAVLGYGANVIDCEPTLESRETTAAKVQQETGATFIHPFNHPHVIAGQGTAALELIEEVPNLDAIIAPVGGGGLISGTACVGSQIEKPIPVFAAEPQGADDAARSKSANELIPSTNPNTIADGLLTSLGSLTWPFVRDVVERIFVVEDHETIEAMKFFWLRTKQIIEPSAAVTFAATLQPEFKAYGFKKVGVILSGGNVDIENLPW